jgi:hypothetical protein
MLSLLYCRTLSSAAEGDEEVCSTHYVVSRFDWVRGRKKDLPCAHGSPDGVPLASSIDELMHAALAGINAP